MSGHKFSFEGLAVFVNRKSPAFASLESAAKLLATGHQASALSHLDRAWRVGPEYAAQLGPVFGKVLMDHARNFEAALAVLTHAYRLVPTPTTAAFIVLANLGLQRDSAAVETLTTALSCFAAAVDGPLAKAADTLILNSHGAFAGWVGLSPQLDVVGTVHRLETRVRLTLHHADGSIVTAKRLRADDDGHRRFSFPLTSPGRTDRLQVTLDGVDLLGSPISLPPDFDLDGRASEEDTGVRGWLRLGWDPGIRSRVLVTDATGRRSSLGTTDSMDGSGRRLFTLRLTREVALRSPLTVSVVLPDGRKEPLPDSPLVLAASARKGLAPRGARSTGTERPADPSSPAAGSPPVDVVIPVFLGLRESIDCIRSVLLNSPPHTHLVIVDDASPDRALSAALDELASHHAVTLLRNPHNLGFAASVNRGMQQHRDRDVVVLNADTLVPTGWLERLRAAAYSADKIGTVTPLTNDGSIVSYPRCGAPLDTAQAERLDRLTALANDGLTVTLPVGIGFCMFIRRACLDDIGELDHSIFGKGYGEETDFCLRAARRGWRHRLAANLFVLHAGGRSFGKRTAALQARSQRLLKLRHPQFPALVRSLEANDPVQTARCRLAAAVLQEAQGPLVLLVSLALQGGVDRFVSERCTQLRQQGLVPLVLHPVAVGATHVVLDVESALVHGLRYAMPYDLPALIDLLRRLPIHHIELHHFMGHDPGAVEALLALPFLYDIYIHDYVWICPQITLIDRSGRYCGEPPVKQCERCVQEIGSNLGEPIKVAALRRRSRRWLDGAHRVIAPSSDTAERLRRHFPGLSIDVEALQPEPKHFAAPLPIGSDPVKVVVLGAIGQHKGYDVLLGCAKDAAARRLPLKFIVIGYTQQDRQLTRTRRVFVTGNYAEVEVPHLLRQVNPHVIFLPSVWPETWSYTLTHALRSGLPVAAFEMGAIAERLRWRQRGYLLNMTATSAELNDRLLEIAAVCT